MMPLSGWCGQRGVPDCGGCQRRGVPCDHHCHDTPADAGRPAVETVDLTTTAL